MAVTQGKCKNCGSLVLVDTKKDQAHCLFCNCVFPKQEALDLLANDEGHTYLNEEQPQYNGPQLSPVGQQKVVFDSPKTTAADRKTHDKTSSTESFTARNKKLPDTKLTNRQRLFFLVSISAIVVIFFALTLPFVVPRERVKSELSEEFTSVIADNTDLTEEQLTLGKNFDIQRQDNSLVTIVVNKADKKLMVNLFDQFCKLRAKAMGQSEVKHEEVTMRILSQNGSFEIDHPQQENLLEAIKQLD